MQDQILQVDENMLETRLDRLVSEKVEQLLNAMLDAEADEITGAARYERTGDRKAYRAGHYERDLTVKAGTVTLRGYQRSKVQIHGASELIQAQFSRVKIRMLMMDHEKQDQRTGPMAQKHRRVD